MFRSLCSLGLLFAAPLLAQTVPSIVPAPVSLRLLGGERSLECLVPAAADELARPVVELLQREWKDGMPIPMACDKPAPITLRIVHPDTAVSEETYWLNITPQGIDLSATTPAGLFRGSRTLVQLVEQGREQRSVPCLSIVDHPRFPWRGMHLDVCRHFFPVEFVKKYIDLLARYKMNSFHWHLTDDQGWRIEIKKYPKLTEVGAWRKGSQVGPYSRREYDTIPYGGFYTQDEIREVVAYAAQRHINVVPEIEMPGHALAALTAHPHLGCTGGPYEVEKGWGVFDDVFCAGNDSVFIVLEDVLTEVMALFPSSYIHIGGDECPKERWKTCPKCQARMKAEKLKDEHELQSYFIKRIERFVNAKGRKIIGWDEILEGGLAPNAAVMSWRGTEGAIAAARSGHYAVMSPGSYCYFDHYQGDPANEPLAIGGYTPLQKVYGYEPVPNELKPEEARYILGAQGNLWAEYILTTDQVEYMAVPRMLALAEVLWTPKAKRDEASFIQRLEKEFPRLDELKVNASRSLYQVQIKPEQGPHSGEIQITLTGTREGMPIKVTLTDNPPEPDGSYWMAIGNSTSQYDGPFTIKEPFIVSASHLTKDIFTNEKEPFPISSKKFNFNLATARPITLSEPPNERYAEGGAFTLVDGITGQEKRVNTEWLGWRKSVTITVDLDSVQDIHSMGVGARNETYSWIHLPKRITFSLSTDGRSFQTIGTASPPTGNETWRDEGGQEQLRPLVPQGRYQLGIDRGGRGRFVRITVEHPGAIPQGYPGAGSPAWLFLDEIEVR
ncbi:MAG: family 20 glycosylhydrolase [Bacteroidetes bacterium]|nr:family 20 glycosylhydrolase [Bacteroidota bacterium]